MSLLRFLGALSPAYTGWVLWSTGAKFVGADTDGNRYYRARPRGGYKRERRFVIYAGTPDASRVPPEWHGWLHHQSDVVPDVAATSFRRPWQKPHRANPTGTAAAWRPAGHPLAGGKRAKASGDYESWTPPV